MLQLTDAGSTCRGGNTTLLKPDFQVPKKGAEEPSSGSGSGSGSAGGSGSGGGGGDDSSEPEQPEENPRCAESKPPAEYAWESASSAAWTVVTDTEASSNVAAELWQEQFDCRRLTCTFCAVPKPC